MVDQWRMPQTMGRLIWASEKRAGFNNCDKRYFERVKEEAVVRNFLLATSDSVSQAVAAFPPPRPFAPVPERGRRSAGLRVVT